MKRLFVANRGEIAVRIIRGAQKLGIQTVAAHSTVDAESLPVRLADEAAHVGGSRAAESYLNVTAVVNGALAHECDALHPGYGFLSESAALAEACEAAGINFVGPSADVLRQMGDKSSARAFAEKCGIPILHGSDALADLTGIDLSSLRYPVLLKAVAGGGGRGIRVAADEAELRVAFDVGSREAAASFGDGRLYLEAFIPRARHLEVQVLADMHGQVVHLGERECSVQRRHQKVLEETPAVVPDHVRQRICTMAVELARSLGYVGAGTVEFVLDDESEDVWFIEMNTRLQVEHGVTELVTGVDLVAQQLRIAQGDPLSFGQEDVSVNGHAIEWRVTAESWADGLLPRPGRITEWRTPEFPGVRLDTHCFSGYFVPPFYDSLLAKLMAHGADRAQALSRLAQAAEQFQVAGVPTTLDLCLELLSRDEVRKGRVTTRWLDGVLAREGGTHVGA